MASNYINKLVGNLAAGEYYYYRSSRTMPCVACDSLQRLRRA